MNQQQKMSAAKKACLGRLKEVLSDFEQVDDYSFASLEDVDGEDWWVVVNIVAKKNYDIDGALEEYAIKTELREKKKEARKT